MKKVYIPVECITGRDLPPVLRIFWNQTDNRNFQIGNLLTALTCFCAMSPRLTFNYVYDGPFNLHHLLVQLCVVGQSSDGKSFSRNIYKLLCKPLLDRDKAAEAAELEYAELKRTKSQNTDKPKEPITVKICLIKFTKNKIIKRSHMMTRKYSEPLTFMIYTDELSTLIERRGSYGDLRDIGKLAYDWGSETSVDTNSDASYNCTTDVNWCSIYNTTPAILYKYIDKDACESGNVNRMTFVMLGDLLGEPAPNYKILTEADMKLIREWQDKLMAETYTPQDNLQPMHEIPMEWLHKDEVAWCDAQREIIGKTCSNAHNSFYKRCSCTAARYAAMAYHLWGEDPRQRNHIRKLYYFLADYILKGQLKLFGRMFEQHVVNIDYTDTNEEENAPLYDQMPKRFTRDMLKTKVDELKLGTKARQFIFKWLRKHLIFEVEGEKDVYEKLY